MDLKPIGSAASLGETAIHNKMASCSVDTASVTPHMQEIAKSICQAFLKMSRKKHFISPIFRGLKEGKSKAKSKNAFYRSSFNVSLL